MMKKTIKGISPKKDVEEGISEVEQVNKFEPTQNLLLMDAGRETGDKEDEKRMKVNRRLLGNFGYPND